VDKDELFPQAAVHPAYRIGGIRRGVRDLVQNSACNWSGGRRDGLLETGGAGCGVWKLSSVVPDISARASRAAPQ